MRRSHGKDVFDDGGAPPLPYNSSHPLCPRFLTTDMQQDQAQAMAQALETGGALERVPAGRRRMFCLRKGLTLPYTSQLLRALKGKTEGVVPGTDLKWREAVEIRLEQKAENLWLVLLPTIWIDRSESADERRKRSEFAREHSAVRYNRQSNDLIDAWAEVMTRGAQGQMKLRLFEGSDMHFEIGNITAFSWRQK